MKFFAFIVVVFVFYVVFGRYAQANTLPSNHYAYCSGYASKMHEVYRLKHYQTMQEFFESQIGDKKDEFTSEYYQSGSEYVKKGLNIKLNQNDKCEVLFARGI